MNNLLRNNDFILCVVSIGFFIAAGEVQKLWEVIGHGLDAVLNSKFSH